MIYLIQYEILKKNMVLFYRVIRITFDKDTINWIHLLRCMRKGFLLSSPFSTILSFQSFFVTRPPALLYKTTTFFLRTQISHNILIHTHERPHSSFVETF